MVQAIMLETERAGDAWWERPRALRALAYELLRGTDPALAETLHEGDGPRPFTAAALPAGQRVLVRLTALEEATSRALLMALADLDERPLSFRDSVVAVAVSRPGLPRVAAASYRELWDHRFRREIPLRFLTPTAFSQGGDRHLPLPVPELMLRSWAARWNRFAAEPLRIPEEVLERVAARTGLARARIETTVVALESDQERRAARQVGFTGRVTLEALAARDWSRDEQRVLAALTSYSRYCGTGVRTTQGFGVTLPVTDCGLEIPNWGPRQAAPPE